MNTHKTLETERLILLPGNNERDNDAFLKMLREDGDFRIFCGVDFSEENLTNFKDYFQHEFNCIFSIFLKELPNELLGYVGIALHPEERYEVEFYLAKKWRNNGYCSEALNRLIQELKDCGISMNGSVLQFDDLYATTNADNGATIRVLEKAGFVRNNEGAILIAVLYEDPVTGELYDNFISEYVLHM